MSAAVVRALTAAATSRNLAEAPALLIDGGLAVFPLPPGRKWDEGAGALDYSCAVTDLAAFTALVERRGWTDPAAPPNIGLTPTLCGLWTLDLDGAEAVAAFAADYTEREGAEATALLAKTVTPGKGGGRHVSFHTPDGNGWGGKNPYGGESRGRGHIVAPGCPHPDGGRYEYRGQVLPVVPDWLRDKCGLYRLGDALTVDNATDSDTDAFLDKCSAVTIPTEAASTEIAQLLTAIEQAPAGSRWPAARQATFRVLEMASGGHLNARTELERITTAYRAKLSPVELTRRDPKANVYDWCKWWVGKHNGALSKPDDVFSLPISSAPRIAASEPETEQTTDERTPAHRRHLDAVETFVTAWLNEPDPDPTRFALAVAVAAVDQGEPLWGMLVGSPSSGKTERVRLCDLVTDDHLDEVTAPALLSWSTRKPPKPVGVLTRIPARALVTIGDFSTILATSDRGGRDQLFAQLRRVYDGSTTRDVGNAPEALRWSGRLTILAAVTPAIDDYSSHADQLGPRWLYLRMPTSDTERRRIAAARPTRGVEQKRADAAALSKTAVLAGREALPSVDLDSDTLDQLADVAVVVAAGRGTVPRDGYGKRPIIGIPVIEEPHRLVAQLRALTRAGIALGLTVDEAIALARRAGLDTVPRARYAALTVLACGLHQGEVQTVRNVAQRGGMHRHVAAIALEDLRELGIASCPVEDDADLDDLIALGNVRRDWQLSGALGFLTSAVIEDHLASVGSKRGDHPHNPPRSAAESRSTTAQDIQAPHTSCPPAEGEAA